MCAGIFVPSLMFGEPPASSTPSSGDDISALFKRFQEVTEKVKQDPKLAELKIAAEAAEKKYMDAYEAAINREEPELLNKIRLLQQQRLQSTRERFKSQAPQANFSPDDAKRYKEARSKAESDPEVVKAAQQRDKAKNTDERAKLDARYTEILKETILKIDPGLAGVLKNNPAMSDEAGGPVKKTE